jgi:hypothetical protein
MTKNQKSGGAQSASGFFADTLGPRPEGGAMLGKNGAEPMHTQAKHMQHVAKTQPHQQPQRGGQQQANAPRAPAPRQPEPEPPKKKKGWF